MRRNKLDLISREGVAKIKILYHQKGVRHEDILDLVPECRRIGWNNSAYISRLAQKEGWERKVAFAPKVRGKRKLGQQAAAAAQAAPQPAPEAAALEPDGMIASLPVYVIEGEPRVRDIDLGQRLGLAQPLNIRKLIKEMEPELRRYGLVHAGDEPFVSGRGRIDHATVFYLNEAQALAIILLSRAPNAADVREVVILTFIAFRQGQMLPADYDTAVRFTDGDEKVAETLPHLIMRDMRSFKDELKGELKEEFQAAVDRAVDEALKRFKGRPYRTVANGAKLSTQEETVIAQVIHLYYDGKSPYDGRPLMEEHGHWLKGPDGRVVFQYDHLEDVGNSDAEVVWPIHRDVHEKKNALIAK